MPRELLKDNFNALLETGSLFGHDLSGQYHVIQFCLDELSERPLDEQTMRFINRIGESLEELIRLTEQARRVFRESALPGTQDMAPRSLREVLELASTQYYVHAAKSWPAIEVHISGDNEVFCTIEAQLYWYLVLPTIMARVQISLKNANSGLIELNIEKQNNSYKWKVDLSLSDPSLLGDFKDPSFFMGEREKRFSWGSQVLASSLAAKGMISCQYASHGLTFSL